MIGAAGPVIPNFGGGGDCLRANHLFCGSWVSGHWGSVLRPALIAHIELTAIALAIGFSIALMAGLLAYRRTRVDFPFSLVSQLLYTFPSIALFQLLVPVTGLNRVTVEIALISYTLLILFRNIVAGLRGVPAEVREAAEGMGLSRTQILLRVELRLAVPAIIAGLRTAAVMVISLATIAAYVVNEGLGAPIFAALQSSFNTELVAAGALAVGLAVLVDGLFVISQRVLTPWAKTVRAA